ncbi:MAG: DUF1416 domain-containing protein [Micromonosporaceae bacterium]|mgnify:CR=1 FL=1
MSGCGAPDQAAPPAVDPSGTQTVIDGTVRLASGDPVAGAYVRLLDCSGEFAAEVVSSPAGGFRFFAAPGSWTVRALTRHGTGEVAVAARPGITEVTVTV